jgi:antitoxin YefM
MTAVTYTNLSQNLDAYMDKVVDDYDAIIVARENGKNVVLVSEETYNNMIETCHQRSKRIL